jgi:hypothetical protein
MVVRNPPRCQSESPSVAGSGIQQSSAEQSLYLKYVYDASRGKEDWRSEQRERRARDRPSQVEQSQLGDGGVAIEAQAYFARTGRLSSCAMHYLQARGLVT